MGSYQEAEHDGSEASADESLPRLLGWQLDQGRTTEEEAKHVRHYVIADNHWHGHDEPNVEDDVILT